MSGERVGGSFRDPVGFVFERDGVLYRQVNASYREAYDLLLASGLYAELVSDGLMIAHREVSVDRALTNGAYRVLQPEQVGFISYPYCWCFSQLRDAALTTLAIQKRALARGMIMKDASAYNVQFHDGRPIFIDTLSFEPYREGEPWTAYRQFCQHFLAPLLLACHRDVRLVKLLRIYLDGFPLDLASSLLPRRTWLRFSTMLHVHLHARSIRRFGRAPMREATLDRPIRRTSLLGLIDSLESAVRGVTWSANGTEWADYVTQHNYGQAGLDAKQRIVRDFLAVLAPATVWDLGANTGTFSRVAAELGASVVAFDADPAAVERAYLAVRATGERRILPLWMDLTNPSADLGWAHRERMSLASRGPADVVLALALVHHLAISNNVPLPDIARTFSSLAPALIVEFVPKSDSQVQRLLASRKDIFGEYSKEQFEAAFRRYYDILEARPVEGTERHLYRMARR